MKRNLHGRRTILTGASSGIGRALAVELGRHGARQILTARREQALQALRQEIDPSGENVDVVVGDITDAGIRNQLIQTCLEKYGGVDLLINNAGVGAIGPFADASPDRLQRIMEVNFTAAVELIRSALPQLQQGHQPMIVNMGSVLGHRAVPNKSEYCDSKFALHGFSDALRAELHPQVDVLLVSPSTTSSEFFDRLLEDQSTAKRHQGMAPRRVAKNTVAAIQWGRQEIILSAGGKALVWLDRLCPPFANWLATRFP